MTGRTVHAVWQSNRLLEIPADFSTRIFLIFFFFFFAEYFPYFRINLFPLLLLISWFYYSNERRWLQVVCFYFRSVQRSMYLLFYIQIIYSHLTTTHVSMLFIFQISVWSQQKIGFNLQIHASVFNVTVM